MPVITSAAMIGGIVTYVGTQLAKNESLSDFFNGLTTETVNWIKPLFLKEDGTLQKEVQKLKDNPTETKKQRVELLLQDELEDNSNAEKYIKEIFEKIQSTSRNEISATKMKAKEGIEFKARQKNKSKATFDDFETEGKINIDINQE